jgi:hypothetical protein
MWLGDDLDSIVSRVDNLDKDIEGLFLLILHNGRRDRIVEQFFNWRKKFIALDVNERWFCNIPEISLFTYVWIFAKI